MWGQDSPVVCALPVLYILMLDIICNNKNAVNRVMILLQNNTCWLKCESEYVEYEKITEAIESIFTKVLS